METKLLAEKVKEIKMPEEMHEHILAKCYENKIIEMERTTMKKNHRNKLWSKSLTIAASLAVCICLTGITALAASGQLKGFFKDKTDWRGAVVGTSYEQATDEIEIMVANSVADELEVHISFNNPNVFPYRELELLRVKAYEILDETGKSVAEETTESYKIVDGLVKVTIPTDNLDGGAYKLVIHTLVGEKKADQPLEIHGAWECGFVK